MGSRLVLFHADCWDGFTAAWAARRRWGDADTEYVPVHHGRPPPPVAGKEVWILDFSYPRATLLKMASEAAQLVVLDHHVTAQQDLHDLPFAVFDMQRSGAGITWDELHGLPRPWLIDYVEDRDLWRHALPSSRAVSAWIGATPRTFEAWDALAQLGVGTAAQLGLAVQQHLDVYVADMLPLARHSLLAGHIVPVVNCTPSPCVSEVVGKLAEGQPFAAGWYQGADGLYTYSLRSRDQGIDVGAIAKSFGGGGHRNASGFRVSTFVHSPRPSA